MASTFTVPMMSTVDSSRYVRSHSQTGSHHRSSQRLTRPLGLARIPSERLDPRSDNYDRTSKICESDEKHEEHSKYNRASVGTNLSITAPSHSKSGQPDTISKRAEAITHDSTPSGFSQSHSSRASPYVNAKDKTSGPKMDSKSSYLHGVFAGFILPSPYVVLSFLPNRHSDLSSAPKSVPTPDWSSSDLLKDLLISLMLTSITLSSLGAYGRYKRRTPNVRISLGVAGDTHKSSTIRVNSRTITRVARRSVAIVLPCFAALQLGGLSVSILLLVMISSGIMPTNRDNFDLSRFQGWKRLFARRCWSLAYSALLCLAAFQFDSSSWESSVAGVLAVVVSTFICSPPYLVKATPDSSSMSPPPSARSTSGVPITPWDAAESSFPLPATKMSSPLIASTEETSLTLISGGITAGTAGLLYLFCDSWSTTTDIAAILCLASLLTTWSYSGIEISAFGETPLPLATGLAAAIIGNILMTSRFHPFWQDAILAAMAFMAVNLDLANPKDTQLAHVPSRPSGKIHRHEKKDISTPTKVLLKSTEGYPLLHGILADKDSRRIFYFMLLNLSFMLVQSTYGVLTGSLGLISDSIHMFFDCFALLVGLCAAVMSKWPPSVKYPYGYGKLDTLAGFGNGIFLMLISIEIIWEAIERLVEGSDVSRTMELLIVSSLGLGVNLVGIMAFEHGHGHGHGGHNHSHGGHAHSHAGHAHPHSDHSASSATPVAKPGKAHHGHGGDNMYGIYLHIMADALGSVAVVISTLCVRYTGWSGFDPLASCAIAILIFASAIPLVFSSGKKLLLSLPGDVEYTLRDVLAGVSAIRGVVGYTAPKFWLDDIGKSDSEHDHHHDHHHEHSDHHHNHDHDHGEHSHCSKHSHSDHQHGGSDHGNHGHPEDESQMILGVIHVIASQYADLDDVRRRVLDYLKSQNMDIVVQVERDGDVKCWCGGSQRLG